MRDEGTPRRPALRWHGGKWRLAPWIIAHMPPHRIYVESFGGGASVLLRKPRAYAEIYNDLDDDVVNLFRVLRDPLQAQRLVDVLRLTPFARVEFVDSYEPTDDPVERARHLLVRSFMGFGSNAHCAPQFGSSSTGFRAASNRSGTTPAIDWSRYPDSLAAVVDRMRAVVIESRDALEVIAKHDSRDVLHYVDPPYLPQTRGRGNKHDVKHRYRHELSVEDHERLLALLVGLKGMVLLSGYPDPLYDAALVGWRCATTPAFADGAKPRTEVLWINPAACRALDARQVPLFQPSVVSA